jgi:hypothetical protein
MVTREIIEESARVVASLPNKNYFFSRWDKSINGIVPPPVNYGRRPSHFSLGNLLELVKRRATSE